MDHPAQSPSSEMIAYRMLEDNDVEPMLGLYGTVFRRQPDCSQWRWTHLKNPCGATDYCLAMAGDQIVGSSASVRGRFIVQGTEVDQGRVQNVMVHPAFRKRGIFQESLHRLTAELDDAGNQLIVTFPNDNSMHTFVDKLDYAHLYDQPIYHLDVAENHIRQLSGNVSIEPATVFSGVDVRILSDHASLATIRRVRSREYLDWRYTSDSSATYFVARASWSDGPHGVAVFKLFAEAGAVDLVELAWPADCASVADLMGAVISHYSTDGASVRGFNVWSASHHPLHGPLLETGFVATKIVTHVVVRGPRGQNTVVDPASYYLSMGDSDVF